MASVAAQPPKTDHVQSSRDKSPPDRATECIHCRLPVPAGNAAWMVEGFCCIGCATAYRLIMGAGLGDYYTMAEQRPLGPTTDGSDPERYRWFDHPDFLEKYTRRADDGRYSVRLALSGIHCAACVWLLEKLPQFLPGVMDARVTWARSTIDLEWDPVRVSLARIATVLCELGYAPYPVSDGGIGDHRRRETREQLIRLAVAGAAAGNNMLIAAALYLGMFAGMAGSIEQLLRMASALVGVVSLVWPGRIFLIGALAALRTRTPHMDLPLALGLFVGTIGSVVNALRGVGDVYFDSISVLIFVLLLGRWIQTRQQRSAAEAIDLLNRLTPRWARRQLDGRFVQVPVTLLREGDIVQVRAEETIPVDGVVSLGRGSVDESILTGESASISKQVGDWVAAGSQNLQATLEIRASATGAQTRIGRIASLVEDAARRKPQIVQWADQMGGRFVVAVLMVAAATLGYWLWAEPAMAVDRVVALLIVACPCALAMATPLAIAVALARAAKHRILIKGGDVLQRLSGTGMVWLDKTGTLTRGQMQLIEWYGDESIQPAVAAIQSHSAHPIAVAMTRHLSRLVNTDDRLASKLQSVEQTSRGGIQANFDGMSIRIGNRRFVESFGGRQIDRFAAEVNQMLAGGITPVYVAADDQVVAVAGVGDPIRGDARWSLNEIRRLGWTVGILSGDHREIVARVARQLDIPPELAHGELLPEDKIRMVQPGFAKRIVTTTGSPNGTPASKTHTSTGTAGGTQECGRHTRIAKAKGTHGSGIDGTVVMIGDGVNDSAALAAASVGIAVRRGAETSLAAAPVYFAQEGLRDMVHLVRLAKTTMRTIRWNFAASLSYNVLAIGLAATGQINPLLAAILMPISSLTVVSLSLLMPHDWSHASEE